MVEVGHDGSWFGNVAFGKTEAKRPAFRRLIAEVGNGGLAPTMRLAVGTLSILAVCALSACEAEKSQSGNLMEHMSSTSGTNVPAGVSEVQKGMTQQDVLNILAHRYTVTHSADADPGRPLMDVFPYSESGVKKYIEILYDENGLVDWVRFGFEEISVLE